MQKRLSLAVAFLTAVLVFSAVAAAEDSIRVVHSLGEAVVKRFPEKIVVFDYAALDIMEFLGIEPTAVAKSSLPQYLERFKDAKYIDAGTLFEPNFERIFALQPDVIFASTRQASVYDELAQIAPTVYFEIDTDDYWGSFAYNARLTAEIFGKEDEAEAELAALAADAARVNALAGASGLRTLVLMANDGALSAYGPGSRFGIVYSEFGFTPADHNLEAATHGQNVSYEYLLQINPEAIFVIDRASTVGGSVTAEQVLDNVLVKAIDAARNGRIAYLTSQVWYTAAGGLKATRIMIDDVMKVFE